MQSSKSFYGFVMVILGIAITLIINLASSGRATTGGCENASREFLQRSISEHLVRRDQSPARFSISSDGIYNKRDKIWMIQVDVAGQDRIALIDCRGGVEFSLGKMKEAKFELLKD